MNESNSYLLEKRLQIRPVLCFVANKHFGERFVRLVTKKIDMRYFTDSKEMFLFARPMTIDDLKHFQLGSED